MSEIVPTSQKVNAVAQYLFSDGFKQQLRLALPRAGVTAERMARIVLTEVRRQPKLADCRVESLLGAVMQCAQLGLEPGPIGLAWIIPYGKEAQLQIGYKGILNLIWQSDRISSVQSEVVYEQDLFTYSNGIPPELRHVPALGDRGEPTHAYAVIGTISGGWIFRVMTVNEIDEHRKLYSKASSGPWDTAWGEMACKTVLKRTAKRAPVSTEAQNAITLDDRAELGVPQDIDAVIEPEAAEYQAKEADPQSEAPVSAKAGERTPDPRSRQP